MEALFIIMALMLGICTVGSLICYAPTITLCFIGIIFALLLLNGIMHIDHSLNIGDCLVAFIFLIISSRGGIFKWIFLSKLFGNNHSTKPFNSPSNHTHTNFGGFNSSNFGGGFGGFGGGFGGQRGGQRQQRGILEVNHEDVLVDGAHGLGEQLGDHVAQNDTRTTLPRN